MFFFKKKTKKVGLALGGGAARGLSHFGVIKAFQEQGIPIDCIAGTSSGSIVGGLYASGLELDMMLSEVQKLKWSDFVGFRLSRKALFSSKPIERLVRRFVGDMSFKDLKIPFTALATDLLTGEGVHLNRSDIQLAHALRASASFPGVFKPYEFEGRYLIDGGAASNIPVDVVRQMGADVVIAVDVIPHLPLEKMPRHVATIVDRGLDLLLHAVSQQICEDADLVLKPVSQYFSSFNIRRVQEMVDLGEAAVMRQLDDIRTLL